MAEKINVMVNGLNPDPKSGKMARMIAERVLSSDRFSLVPYSLTGPEVTESCMLVSNAGPIVLIKPDAKEAMINIVKESQRNFVSLEAALPAAVNDNADFYCRHKLPFVMLTTGGDRKALEERIRNSEIVALPSTNIAPPIVGLMHFMDGYSKAHPNVFTEHTINTEESHQSGKKDTSGTAKAMLKYFSRMGFDIDTSQIDNLRLDGYKNESFSIGLGSNFTAIREKHSQEALMIPEEYLGGHGWHRYEITPNIPGTNKPVEDLGNALEKEFFEPFGSNPCLPGYDVTNIDGVPKAVSPDGNVMLQMRWGGFGGLTLYHNINGRGVYVDGALDFAVPYVWKEMRAGKKGEVCSMIDALKKN